MPEITWTAMKAVKNMKMNEYEAVIEAALFVAGEEVSLTALADMIEMDKATTKAIVNTLIARYSDENRGMRIIEIGEGYQMCTSPSCFETIRKIYKVREKHGLSPTLLETLAIIAYKQPVTKAEIEEIRGVNSDHAVNRLVEKGLVCETGKKDVPGKPILFGTTTEFLRYFGFKGMDDLPEMEETENEPLQEE